MKTSPTSHFNAVAICIAGVLATLALAVGVGSDLLSDSQAPVTKLLVAECQRFDALATAGGRTMTCAADPVIDTGTTEPVAPPMVPSKA